jgi:hypothetical protein
MLRAPSETDFLTAFHRAHTLPAGYTVIVDVFRKGLTVCWLGNGLEAVDLEKLLFVHGPREGAGIAAQKILGIIRTNEAVRNVDVKVSRAAAMAWTLRRRVVLAPMWARPRRPL